MVRASTKLEFIGAFVEDALIGGIIASAFIIPLTNNKTANIISNVY
jgi:hypothetical protein